MVRRYSKYYDSPSSRIPQHIMEQREKEDHSNLIEMTAIQRCDELEIALAAAHADHELLMRLMVRMGGLVGELVNRYEDELLDAFGQDAPKLVAAEYDLTIIGQRQLEAELREAEGEPEGHGLVEDVQ